MVDTVATVKVSNAMSLPALLRLDQVQDRLQVIFPTSFPDRGLLVGEMAAKLFFVALYGNFIEGTGQWFRPSTVIRFSHEQKVKTADEQRQAWLMACHAPGYKPANQWYADNTREPVRDDLIRNRLMPIGIVVKRPGLPPTSPAPIYALAQPFASLFDPALEGEALESAVAAWQDKHLDTMTLKRMRLLAKGVQAKEGQVEVTLPTTGKTLRLAAGDASTITKDVCEVLARKMCVGPVVVHVSLSDMKLFRELEGEAEAIGLTFNANAELPDVVFADVGCEEGMVVTFVEVVHSDGPISEVRKKALLQIAKDAGIEPEHVRLVTAFEDRNAPAFKKRVSELARGSSVWFRSEPDMLVDFRPLGG